MSPKDAPKGARLLVKDPWRSLAEVVVLEWSPSGERVKLRYASGMATWIDAYDAERLAVVETLHADGTTP